MRCSVKSIWTRAVLGVTALTGLCVVLATGLAQADYVSAVLADNPVAYWRLNETGPTGTTVYDVANAAGSPQQGAQDGVFLTDNSNAGLGQPGPRPTDYPGFLASNNAGRFWSSQTPSGTSRVDAGNPTALQITGALTLEAWVYSEASATTDRGVIGKEIYSTLQRSYSLLVRSGNKPSFLLSANGSTSKLITSATGMPTDTWVHLAGVYVPGASMTLYRNGVLDISSTTSIPASIFNSTSNFWIGLRYGIQHDVGFQGLIDEVAVYNYALSAEQIKAHYDASFVPIPEPGTLAMLAAALVSLLCYAWRKQK